MNALACAQTARFEQLRAFGPEPKYRPEPQVANDDAGEDRLDAIFLLGGDDMVMGRKAILAGAVGASLAGIPANDMGAGSAAHAQSAEARTGSRVEQEFRRRDLAQNRDGRYIDQFADCIYDRNRNQVHAFFAASDPVTIDFESLGLISERRFQTAFGMGRCMEDVGRSSHTGLMISWSAVSLRLMMMEEAYLDRYPTPPAWLDDEELPVERSYISADEVLGSAMALGTFSDCLATTAPREADALLRTPRRSEAEGAVVQRLVPHLGACLAEGHRLGLEAENVRQFAAEGLWQISVTLEARGGNASRMEN